jgi:hypothetical protein
MLQASYGVNLVEGLLDPVEALQAAPAENAVVVPFL